MSWADPPPFPELIGLEGAMGFWCRTEVENIALIGCNFDSNPLTIYPDLDALSVKTCSGECITGLGQKIWEYLNGSWNDLTMEV